MTTPDNKTRKRKWDDHGSAEQEAPAPPNPSDALAAAAAVAAKLQNSNSHLSSSTPPVPTSTDATKNSNSIQQQVNEQLAKITANLQAKGINIQNNKSNNTGNTPTATSETASPTVNPDPYNLKDNSLNKGNFCKNIEINDVKNKYMLTKASLLDKLQEETKAEIITRGKYYSNKALATPKDPPLYLHVAAETQEILDNAVKKIQEIIDSTPPVIVHSDTTTSAYHKPAGQPSKRFHTAKVFIGIDDRSFNAKTKLIGIQGANVKHINRETGARLQLRGKGSGFIEPTSGTEAFEPMFFQISSVTEEGLEKAKQLVDDLIKTVKAEYERFKQFKATRPNNPRPPHYNAYNQNPYNTYQQPNPYQAQGYTTYSGYTAYPTAPIPQTSTETGYQATSTPALPNTPAPPLPSTTSSDTTQSQTAATTDASSTTATAQSYYQTAPTAAQGQYANYNMYYPYYYYQPPLPAGSPPLPSNTPPLPPSTSSTATEAATPPLPSTPYQPQSPNTK
ncbi:hypothetical protein BCR36DRAFT_318864 [Piromyces finnis]|uniref:K Homology domain-containing protein n=1 Tax=Piromyces finnis TaxID=1754191 RepID=A0A1Y1VJJ1_9FUNG|nr:hypothetical protein BCR36DRAFT_318864 [Piromyces finnis]|eukprot:ORX57879.1 hypothetical protein BCR36DRAFT_318864 [Piromyces finnis]